MPVISGFGNIKFKLIVMYNLYSISSCITILKSSKPKVFWSLDDRADFSTFAMC